MMDWDSNSVARLFGVANFKVTQSLSVSSEQKILHFLGFRSVEELEQILIIEIAFDEMSNLLRSMK